MTWADAIDLKRLRLEYRTRCPPANTRWNTTSRDDGLGLRNAGIQQPQWPRPRWHRHVQGGWQGGLGANKVLLTLPWDETFDIGSDAGTPVDDHDYQVPFAFTGKINKLTFAMKPPVLTEDDKKKLMEAYRAAQDAN